MRKAALLDKKPLTATSNMLEMAKKKTLEKRNRQSGIIVLRRII